MSKEAEALKAFNKGVRDAVDKQEEKVGLKRRIILKTHDLTACPSLFLKSRPSFC